MNKRGEGHLRVDGYIAIRSGDRREYGHILVAEKALGRRLPIGAEVHHVNENKNDNRPENLVICPSQKYHALLHMRMRAMKAGFPPHYRACSICKQFDDPEKMYVKPSGNHPRHRTCKDHMRVYA